MYNNQTGLSRVFTLCLMTMALFSFGQEEGLLENNSIYATVQAEDALELKKLLPDEVNIFATINGESVVWFSERAAETMHHNVLTHGPGYVYMSSLEEALESVQNATVNKLSAFVAPNYTIDQDQTVLASLDLVDNLKIEATILKLEGYGTRYHTTSSATQSVVDIRDTWAEMANGRSDISTRLVNHSSSNMPSAVMTIQGTTFPDEYVIIGGHIDSTNPRNNADAPGADDDASGIATITEAARVLIAMGFKPQRTIEFMAYAAEEVGLRGSREIAQDYKSRNVNVIAASQFDMTNYNGSPNDIYLIDDQYTTPVLNEFYKDLMDYYNASGPHQLTYGTTQCNYGCSDHASWTAQGYHASFPFEASFSGSNPNIHTARDTYANTPTGQSVHAAKFAKLALEFLIEVAKTDDGTSPVCNIPAGLNADDVTASSASIAWSAANGAVSYDVRYRSGNSAWVTANASGTSYSSSGLSPLTAYEYQVRSRCSGDNSDYSSSIFITTLEEDPVAYCTSSGNSVNYEWIESVSVGSLENSSSSDGGYGDFTDLTIELAPGSSYPFTLTPGFQSSQTYAEYWRIWIDYNHDGDFEDPGENVFDIGSASNSGVSGTFTVPSGVTEVTTRMRVSMRYRNAVNSCGGFDYGEVEDYTVIINPTVSRTTAVPRGRETYLVGNETFELYPNPAEGNINLIMKHDFEGAPRVKIMTLEGRTLSTKSISSKHTVIDISSLPEQAIYIVLMEDKGRYSTVNFLKK